MHDIQPNIVAHRCYGNKLKGLMPKFGVRLAALKGRLQCAVGTGNPAVSIKISSKSAVIAAAVAYIEQLEAERDRTATRIIALQNQVVDLQKVVDHNYHAIPRHQEKAETSAGSVLAPSIYL